MKTVACVAAVVSLGACFKARPSQGGGQISAKDTYEASREPADPSAIEVPPGYRVELVADELTFPTGVTFGPRGEVIVVESGYSVGDKVTTPKILAFENGARRVLVTGPATNNGAPWNGITFEGGALYVAQGGQLDGGRIARYDYARLGEPTLLVENLPSLGDHHTNGPIVRDGWVYFGQGTATNSGVVGVDSHEFGWLARHPEVHDTPCEDVTLTGTNFTSKNPLTEADDEVTTGAYLPFGTPSTRGQVIAGKLPCNGAVMRVRTTGGPLELVAWGFRNPYGLAFAPDGTLYVADNGHDTRGSRPVFGSADMLWKVERGRWYGWPDFSEGRPLTAGWYSEAAGDTRGFVLAEHPHQPPEPVIYFPVHASADGLDFSTNAAFGHVGHGFVALFGDQAPTVGKTLHPVGFAVMKVDPATGELEYFARNRPDRPGPASKRETRGLERPIAARFDREGKALYIVDFGIVQMTDKGPDPIEKTGRVWRITKEAARASR